MDAVPPSPTDTEVAPVSTWTLFPDAPVDFARLIPLSDGARFAFREQVRQMLYSDTYPTYTKRFAYYSYTAAELSDLTSASFSDSDANSSRQRESRPSLPSVVGFWRLCMLEPAPRSAGWVGGSARKKGVDVEFILGNRTDDIHGYHVRLQRNLDTGSLLVISDRHQVFVDGVSLQRNKEDREQPLQDYQVAVGHRAILTVGKLTFLLELQELSLQEDKRQIEEARRAGAHETTVHTPDFYLTPSQSNDITKWKGYDIYPAFARGSQGRVSYAVKRATGNVCAVKEILFDVRGLQCVQNEIRMLQRCEHVRPRSCPLSSIEV